MTDKAETVPEFVWQFTFSFKRSDLKSFFISALKDPKVFHLNDSSRERLAHICADLISRGRHDIFKAVTAKVMEENRIFDTPKLEEKVLRAIGLEMGKMALYFKQLDKDLNAVESAAACTYLTLALREAGLVSLHRQGEILPEPQNVPLEKAQELISAYFDAGFDPEEYQRGLENGYLEGLSARDLEELRRYTLKKRFNFRLDPKTLSIAAAILIAFALYLAA